MIKICQNCKKEFITKPSAKRIYCSVKCAGQFRSKNVSIIKKICPSCKKEFIVTQHDKKRIYCSVLCANKLKCSHLKGKNNPSCRPEVRKKIRDAVRGEKNGTKKSEVRKKLSDIGKTKIGPLNSFYNHKHSKKSLLKMSNSHKGCIPWNKSKTGIYSEESLNKMSNSLKGRKVWNKGLTKHTDKRLLKASKKLIYKVSGRKRLGRKPSNLEYQIKDFLESKNIIFNFNKPLDCGVPDFLFEKLKKVIEVNGCYHHVCDICYPKMKENIDKHIMAKHTLENYTKKKKWYKNNNYKLLEVWGHEFIDFEKVKQKIIEFLENG